MFVERCIGGVMITSVRIVSSEGAEIGMEKRILPRIKSSWSATGREEPDARLIRRLTKECKRSPTKAPSDKLNPSNKL